MKNRRCDHEERVLNESRTGSLSTSTRSHLDRCQECATAIEIDRWLAADAERVLALGELPDPVVIWWRSRHQARHQKVQRAVQPILFAERLALVVGILGLAAGASMIWPSIRVTADRWLGTWLRMPEALPLGGQALVLILLCSVVLAIGFGLYSQWAED